jgi:hypothetical protein
MIQENISFFIDEDTNENNNDSNFDINEILNMDYIFTNEDNLYTNLIHYDINYTVKQLLLICDYYGIAKDLKSNKCNKCDVLNTLVIYENNIENNIKVNKRKKLWNNINELKNDKFMKKYVLWN